MPETAIFGRNVQMTPEFHDALFGIVDHEGVVGTGETFLEACRDLRLRMDMRTSEVLSTEVFTINKVNKFGSSFRFYSTFYGREITFARREKYNETGGHPINLVGKEVQLQTPFYSNLSQVYLVENFIVLTKKKGRKR